MTVAPAVVLNAHDMLGQRELRTGSTDRDRSRARAARCSGGRRDFTGALPVTER